MLELLSGSFQAALWSKISPPVSFPPSFQTNCSDFVEPFFVLRAHPTKSSKKRT